MKKKSQPKWVVRAFILLGAVLGGIFAFISHPIGGTNAQTPTTATLLPGEDFNVAIRKLSGEGRGNTSYRYFNGWYPLNVNKDIEYIVRANDIPDGVTTTGISSLNSLYSITAWYDSNNKTLYYHTVADSVAMNEDSSKCFSRLQGLQALDLSNWDTSSVENMGLMFSNATISGNLNLSNWDTSSVENMGYMFGGATISGELEGLSNWDTSSVTDMNSMFGGATISGNLNLSNWNTSRVTDMSSMFGGATISGELEWLSNWDTSSVTDMSSMFEGATISGELEWLSNLDTSSVENMYHMFGNATISGNLNLSNWDTSSVTSMYSMFSNATISGDLNLSNWNLSSLNGMRDMFYGTTMNGILDLSNWNTSSLEGNDESSDSIFWNSKISTIYAGEEFKVYDQYGFGYGADDLVGIFESSQVVGQNGTECGGEEWVPYAYLRVDRPGEPGCFWERVVESVFSSLISPVITEGFQRIIGNTTEDGIGTPTVTINNVTEAEVEEEKPVVGEVNVSFNTNENVTFNQLVEVKIPVNGRSKVIVKVKHGGFEVYNYDGLTTNRNASCSNGEPTSSQYNGETINVVDGYATIYTCAASSFIALGIGSGESLGNTGQVTLTLTEGNNTCIVHDYNLGTQSVSSLATHVASEAQEIACEFLKDTGVIVTVTMTDLADGEKTIGAGNFTGIIAPGGFFGSIQALLNRSFNLSGMTLIYEKSGNTIGLWTGTLQIDGVIPQGTPSGSYTGTLEIVIQPKI